MRRNGLDRGLRADGHEDRRFDHAVGRMQAASARAGLLADVQKLKFEALSQFYILPQKK